MQYIYDIDFKILDLIQQNLTSPFMDKLMPAVTSLGNAGIMWIIIGVVLLAVKKYRRVGVAMIVALILCLIIGNLGLKPLIARQRPFGLNEVIELLIPPPQDFSFPSGHTMVSFAGAVTIFVYHRKWGIAALALAAAIAFSRLYLYVHFPSDVLFGMVIGVGIGIFSPGIAEKILHYKPKKPR